MMLNKVRQGGFTAVEAVISLLVLTILIGICLSIVVLSNQMNARTKAYNEANSQVFAKLQEYELKDFGDITNGVSANDYEIEDFSDEVEDNGRIHYTEVEAKVYCQPVSGSLKKIRAVVDFSYAGEARRIEYATYIQIGGVGR